MAPFEALPADQKAVLRLVLRQGRSYEEIAGLLRIAPDTVRDRALAALDALGPQDVNGLDDEQRAAIGDHLLGQQQGAGEDARALLAASPSARAWAGEVTAALDGAGLGDRVPGLPAQEQEEEAAAEEAEPEPERSSRLGGVLLLVGGALIVVLALLALFGVFSSDKKSSDSAAAPTATQAQTTTGTTGTQVEAQINLTRPAGASGKALGVASIVSQDGQRAIAVVGQDLAPSGHYVLWLRNGSQVKFLGFFPPVTGRGKSAGRLQGLVGAPTDLASYKEMLVSREPSSTPRQPTNIVLQGSLGG